MRSSTDKIETNILDKDISFIKGVGEARKKALVKMGIETVGDILRCYPRAYQNRGDTLTLYEIKEKLIEGESGPFSSILTISSEPTVKMIRRGMTIMKLRAFDETGSVEITYFNQPYLKDTMHTGSMFRFFGKFGQDHSRLTLTSPISEPYYEGSVLPDIVPVYPLTSGLTQKFMKNTVIEALNMAYGELHEYLPHDALEELKLPTYSYTLENIHRPSTISAMENAKRRLVFEELYFMFLSMAISGGKAKCSNTIKHKTVPMNEFLSAIPFELTNAQKRSIDEIRADMSGDFMMNRIVTGDVGSGKTIVAAAAMYASVRNGYRAALMVPTEILAVQHFEDLSELFGKLGIRCALLTGSTKKRERDMILGGLSDQLLFENEKKIDIVIGTHALISEGVNIDSLGLAVIDEQHRFGVMQRAALFEKAENVHCLVMSATPIPRTLTLAAYGSIDVSRIDELPKGRQKIDTFIVNEGYRERLNSFIRKQKEEGHQTYVVCPAVDEAEEKGNDNAEEAANLPFIDLVIDDSVPLKAATVFADYLATELPDLSVTFVHGKMKPAEKDRVMSEFVSGKIDVLVSTTVIEVGVNVPNATLMIVENAERFGLSQLHQLRGRVGRGKHKSYFILVSDTKKPDAQNRLRAVKNTTDGFEIAEYDLEMRGPGDFFNESGVIRQHGQMNFKLAATCRDTNLINRASYYAKRSAQDDPDLSNDKNKQIKARLDYYKRKSDKVTN
ncbi:MAG: ATP-dependent DNA helicase RecG [Ruminococcaceae bacterium]|nr:ATP-dependent DNA helicase RecG [Oscillospiraceae bacterium]